MLPDCFLFKQYLSYCNMLFLHMKTRKLVYFIEAENKDGLDRAQRKEEGESPGRSDSRYQNTVSGRNEL